MIVIEQIVVECADGLLLVTLNIKLPPRPPLVFELDWSEIPEGIF